ncbi:MAG TPA: 50S ribosomal protein L5 [Bacteroidia bacterium]|jgi:large subunit ribosomal protein L5|nr:50S ribosomal protein L5 [Bacteroidia bacterium]
MNASAKYQPRLKTKYQTEIIKNLQEKFQYKNPFQVPRLVKIVINQGVGEAVADKKLIESSIKELSTITGQKPIPTTSKKDISNFKLRKGVAIGTKVTLRGDKMYEFLDRLIAAALPRIRDFKGVNPKSFDGKGNYNLGISEQIIFPEIDIDKVNKIMGMDINFVTTAKTDKEAYELLKEFGMPFKKN